jgi:hypothetical protein
VLPPTAGAGLPGCSSPVFQLGLEKQGFFNTLAASSVPRKATAVLCKFTLKPLHFPLFIGSHILPVQGISYLSIRHSARPVVQAEHPYSKTQNLKRSKIQSF